MNGACYTQAASYQAPRQVHYLPANRLVQPQAMPVEVQSYDQGTGYVVAPDGSQVLVDDQGLNGHQRGNYFPSANQRLDIVPTGFDKWPQVSDKLKQYDPRNHKLSIDLVGLEELIRTSVCECQRFSGCGAKWVKDAKHRFVDRRLAYHVVLVPKPRGKSREWRAEVTGYDGHEKQYVFLLSGPLMKDIVDALTELLAMLDDIRRPRSRKSA